MPSAVIWIEIEQKHLNRIARIWTIACIVVQVLALIAIIYTFVGFTLITFEETSVRLTPTFYIDAVNYFFYFTFMTKDAKHCEEQIVKANENNQVCICELITTDKIIWLNSSLAIILLGGVFCISFGIYAHW